MEEKISLNTWIAFISMVLGMFMAVLDIQIVASSLKEIQAGLQATQDEISWIQTSYLIAEVIVIPLSGWLSRAFSTRVLFAVSSLGFTLMSLACAASWDLNSMICFRFLQGIFGGSMIPTVFASIFTMFPFNLRAKVTVVIGLVVTVAPITGPILGGYITDYLSWHYLFILNLIPGIIVTLLVLKFVDIDKPNYQLLQNIDFIGIILVSISLGTFQYILEEGVRENWLDSLLVRNLATICFLSFVMMLYIELTHKNPIVDLSAFKDVNFACSCLLSFILGWGLYTAVFILPLYLGFIKNLDSLQIGEYLCVMGAFQLISGPCAGALSKKLNLKIILSFGLFLFGLSFWLNSYTTADSGFEQFFVPQAVRGFSIMFCFVPITTLAYVTIPSDKIKAASGLYSLMRNLGGAIGLAVSNSFIQIWTKRNYVQFRENIDATNYFSNSLLNTLEQKYYAFNYVDPHQSSLSTIFNMAQREAFVITFNQINTHIAIMFFSSLLLMFFIKKSNLK